MYVLGVRLSSCCLAASGMSSVAVNALGGAGRQIRRGAHLRSHLNASRVMPCPRVSSFSFSYGWGTP